SETKNAGSTNRPTLRAERGTLYHPLSLLVRRRRLEQNIRGSAPWRPYLEQHALVERSLLDGLLNLFHGLDRLLIHFDDQHATSQSGPAGQSVRLDFGDEHSLALFLITKLLGFLGGQFRYVNADLAEHGV